MRRAPTVGWVPATAALALASAGCWVLNSSYGEGGGATAGGSGTTSGVTGATSTMSSGGESGATIGSETGGASGSSGSSGTTGTSGTSGTSGVSSSSTGSSGATGSSSGGGGLCPALDAFNNLYSNDPECRACIDELCCAEFEACVGPCVPAADCVANDVCIATWGNCAGFLMHDEVLIAGLKCAQGVCFAACNIGPCAGPLAGCEANPACKQTYLCTLDCPGNCDGDPICFAQCAYNCDQANPNGQTAWEAVYTCSLNAC